MADFSEFKVWLKQRVKEDDVDTPTLLQFRQVVRDVVRRELQRRRNAEGYVPKPSRWDSVDWSKSTSQIAEEMGVASNTVSHQRRRRAPDTVQKVKPATGWDTVDWSELDVEIAAELGVSRERVRQKRKALSLPSPAGTKVARTAAKLLAAYSPEKTLAEIARKAGVRKSYASKLLNKRGLTCRTPEHKHHIQAKAYWGKVDWTKTNTDIARELGMHEPSVSRNRKKFAPDHLKSSPYRSRGKTSRK